MYNKTLKITNIILIPLLGLLIVFELIRPYIEKNYVDENKVNIVNNYFYQTKPSVVSFVDTNKNDITISLQNRNILVNGKEVNRIIDTNTNEIILENDVSLDNRIFIHNYFSIGDIVLTTPTVTSSMGFVKEGRPVPSTSTTLTINASVNNVEGYQQLVNEQINKIIPDSNIVFNNTISFMIRSFNLPIFKSNLSDLDLYIETKNYREKMYVDDYIEAMSVADIGKPEKEDDRKYSEQGIIENHYLGGHLEK